MVLTTRSCCWDANPGTGRFEPVSVYEIFREIADGTHSFEHDVLYGALGSDIVHSGPLSLSRIVRGLGDRRTFELKPMPVSDMCSIALAASNTAMFLVLDSLTQYLGLDLSAEMDPLKATWKTNPYARVGEPDAET
jgi:hypothetical protein